MGWDVVVLKQHQRLEILNFWILRFLICAWIKILWIWCVGLLGWGVVLWVPLHYIPFLLHTFPILHTCISIMYRQSVLIPFDLFNSAGRAPAFFSITSSSCSPIPTFLLCVDSRFRSHYCAFVGHISFHWLKPLAKYKVCVGSFACNFEVGWSGVGVGDPQSR